MIKDSDIFSSYRKFCKKFDDLCNMHDETFTSNTKIINENISNLKNCPFCNNQVLLNVSDTCYIHCKRCNLVIWNNSKQKLIDSWNKRI